MVAVILCRLAMLSSQSILHKATAVSDMTTSSPACPFTVSSFAPSIVLMAHTTATKAIAFTAVPLPAAIIIHFAALNTTAAAPAADSANTTGAIHNTTTDSILLATNCLCLAIHLATARITTAVAAASTITTRLLLPTHLDANFTPATTMHPSNNNKLKDY